MNTTLIRKLRLVTGLVLLAYVASHLVNLSLGVWSLETMDAARPAFMAVWQNPIGLLALYASMGCHMALGLYALYVRRTMRMSPAEAMQLIMALVLPPLLVMHLLGTRVVSLMVDVEASYAWLMVIYWKWLPWTGLRQVLVVMVAWIHGCIGFYYWAHLQNWWRRGAVIIYPLALLVPVMALLGFVEGGKQALQLAEDEAWINALIAESGVDEVTLASLYYLQRVLLISYVSIVGVVLCLLAWRVRRQPRNFTRRVNYLHGSAIESPPGVSLLEVSRLKGVPHTSMCGGKGRCGTCRVRILEGGHFLPRPSPLEADTLRRIDADADVRLACQAVPLGSPITLSRLVGIGARVEAAHGPSPESASETSE